ncbi:phosphoribosylglycinamide formyltransferase [Parvularcula bermudensis HTCC2503]|uniref:Phosphoribosylglycinamide formyltransferase n=1 Tax=Parvularcula bermudensis (strain ATCC BAA-594 / HTCC2503 / KCTC 12087) TaxID=314260 RepID=E0TC20_PARBH|nr:phosphoribosylglycinamide formyltransferase [Parvularcula bermudensis]ADM09813.1 phosphoribosylglycinamide formyltransferase [Parvularcula bermudensis HTCC2503]
MIDKKRVAVLISGSGSNLQALIEASRSPDYPAEIVLVLSNRPGVFGLERAAAAEIPSVVIPHGDYPSRAAFDAAMQSVLTQNDIDCICLAGFMRILTPSFTKAWEGRMLNIHPSLLPAFKGYDAIGQVLASSVSVTGASVHTVTSEVDAGDIVAQGAVRRDPDDTRESLTGRIHAVEHLLYPYALRSFLRGEASPPPAPALSGAVFSLNHRSRFREYLSLT